MQDDLVGAAVTPGFLFGVGAGVVSHVLGDTPTARMLTYPLMPDRWPIMKLE
jgi:hypothetical protein